MDVAARMAIASLLAIIVTKLVDAIRNKFDEGKTAPKWIWNVLSFALGVGLVFSSDANVLAGIIINPDVGNVITGLFVGAGASVFHEFLNAISNLGKNLAASAALKRTEVIQKGGTLP